MIDSRFTVIVAFIVMAISNIISTTSSIFNHTNNTKISQDNPTALTPDGLTFSIWGPIYLFELGTVIFQCWKQNTVIKDSTRNWLSLAFITNAIWLPVFAYAYWWLSLLVIAVYLLALNELYSWNLDIDYANNKVCWKDKVWAYTGISLNLAWVTVATLLNITIVFRNSRIVYTETGFEIIGGNPDWAVACIVVAGGIAIYKLYKHADVVYTLATSWALFGIYRNQTEIQRKWALVFASVLAAVSILRFGIWIVYYVWRMGKSSSEKKPPLRTNLLRQDTLSTNA